MKNISFTTALFIFTLVCVSESTTISGAGAFILSNSEEQLPIWQPAVKRIQVQGV